jgi:hypothetical protein
MKTLGDYELPLAYCTLYLKNEKWLPLGISTTPSAKHRCDPNGPVITFEISGAVDGSHVIAWGRPRFMQRRVADDGSLEPVDLSRAVDVLSAPALDAEYGGQGVVGINEKLLERKSYPQDWQPTAALMQQAMNLAAELIAQKAAGGNPTGVHISSDHLGHVQR